LAQAIRKDVGDNFSKIMKLSIIIVSWQVKDLLENCLRSIYAKLVDLNFEVIVVDNNSTDGTVEMVRSNFPQTKILASRNNLGFARANNLGLKNSSGDFVLFLNPDTEFFDSSLTRAINFIAHDKKIGILGARLLNADLTLQPSVRRFPALFDHLIMMFKLHHLFLLKRYLALDFNYDKTQNVEQVMGALFLVSRQCLNKIGFWDEKYYLWFEEVDFCQRAIGAGFKVVYFAQTEIIHYGGRSFNQEKFNLKKQWIFSLSRLNYIKKHQSVLAYWLIFLLTPISLFLSIMPVKNDR
jgi:hypothetical protein